MDLLHRSARSWPVDFRAGVGAMLDTVDAEFAGKATDDKPSASYLVPLQQCIFRFLCKAFVGADPSADWLVDNFGFTILDIWLAWQILPTQKVGLVQPLEELLIHSFPLPSFLIWPGYYLLYRFVEKHGAEAVAYAETQHGIGKKDAINNILFVLGFNAFGGFSVFLPFLVAKVGDAADATGLRPRLRRRRDFVLRSHGGTAYQVSKGEVLCGYQPLAMRDPEVFDRPEEFVPERFLGDDGAKLLQHLFWSNGPETAQPAPGNKQCAAKEVVVDTACMLLAEMFRRYDDFVVEGTSFTKLVKREPSPSLSPAAAAGAQQ
ncbi:unnamed protein product [Miscanthus lutarioriparius]|uniref:Uncharacterized protein n=1 Tax=Miscanthus lutarioriparius TaxID=422564 RepID=A0A811PYH0_9POAL|nr:unnamed protein product [Miscanthus lutarioriparius]